MDITHDPANGSVIHNYHLFTDKDFIIDHHSFSVHEYFIKSASLQDHFHKQAMSDSSSEGEEDNEILEGINEVEHQNCTHSFDFHDLSGLTQ